MEKSFFATVLVFLLKGILEKFESLLLQISVVGPGVRATREKLGDSKTADEELRDLEDTEMHLGAWHTKLYAKTMGLIILAGFMIAVIIILV